MATQTPAYTATLFRANGQQTVLTYPHKQAGKPSAQTAAAFLKMAQAHPHTADAVRVEILDNKGSRGVLAAA